jgi:hypothetical protein
MASLGATLTVAHVATVRDVDLLHRNVSALDELETWAQ